MFGIDSSNLWWEIYVKSFNNIVKNTSKLNFDVSSCPRDFPTKIVETSTFNVLFVFSGSWMPQKNYTINQEHYESYTSDVFPLYRVLKFYFVQSFETRIKYFRAAYEREPRRLNE